MAEDSSFGSALSLSLSDFILSSADISPSSLPATTSVESTAAVAAGAAAEASGAPSALALSPRTSATGAEAEETCKAQRQTSQEGKKAE